MKTFSDYINEKQNFIFGGKAGLTGKEYDNHEFFGNLKKDSSVYFYKLNIHSARVYNQDELKVYEVVERPNDYKWFIIRGHWVVENSDTHMMIPKDKFYSDIRVSRDDTNLSIFYVWVTHELSKDELFDICIKYKKDSNVYEKQNFIFGGKAGLTGKEYGVHKTFEELEKGDVIYLWNFDYNNEVKRKEPRTINSTRKTNYGQFELEVKYPSGNIAIVTVPMHRIKYATHGWVSDNVFCAFTTYDMDKDELLAAIKEERGI